MDKKVSGIQNKQSQTVTHYGKNLEDLEEKNKMVERIRGITVQLKEISKTYKLNYHGLINIIKVYKLN